MDAARDARAAVSRARHYAVPRAGGEDGVDLRNAAKSRTLRRRGAVRWVHRPPARSHSGAVLLYGVVSFIEVTLRLRVAAERFSMARSLGRELQPHAWS